MRMRRRNNNKSFHYYYYRKKEKKLVVNHFDRIHMQVLEILKDVLLMSTTQRIYVIIHFPSRGDLQREMGLLAFVMIDQVRDLRDSRGGRH